MHQRLTSKFFKLIPVLYFQRILIFILFFYGIVRPFQSSLNENIVVPIIEKKNQNLNNSYSVRH